MLVFVLWQIIFKKKIESVSTAETIQTSQWQYTYDSTIMQLDYLFISAMIDFPTIVFSFHLVWE